jgi:hypothetical protein
MSIGPEKLHVFHLVAEMASVTLRRNDFQISETVWASLLMMSAFYAAQQLVSGEIQG